MDNSTWRILKLLKVRDPPRSNQFVYFPRYFSEINISVKYLNMAFLTSSSSPLRSKGWLSSRSSSSHSFSEARTGVCCHPGCTAKLCLPQALAWRAGSGSWALTKTGTLFVYILFYIMCFIPVSKHVLQMCLKKIVNKVFKILCLVRMLSVCSQV